jgi:transposase
MLKRGGKVFTQVVPDVKAATLRKIIRSRVASGTMLYTDGFQSYHGLVLDGYEHYRINHKEEFVNGKRHINGIESFWSFAKQKLARFYGVRPRDFAVYLKEMEFRFNNREQDVEKLIWQAYRRHQLSHNPPANTRSELPIS